MAARAPSAALPQAWGETCQQMVSVALDLYGINPQLVVVSHQ